MKSPFNFIPRDWVEEKKTPNAERPMSNEEEILANISVVLEFDIRR